MSDEWAMKKIMPKIFLEGGFAYQESITSWVFENLGNKKLSAIPEIREDMITAMHLVLEE